MVGEDFPVILDWPGAQDNNVMRAKPDLRGFLKWMITRSCSVITAVITLGHSCLKQTLFQFSTFALLVVVTMIATGVAADVWVVNSQQLCSDEWFPTFFPPLGLLKLSVVCAPVLGTTAMIAACAFWFRCRPFFYSPVLFLCCAPLVFIVPLSAAMRIMTVLVLANLLLFVEISVRKLPSDATYASSCCLCVIFCYYMFVTSLFAGAYV